MLGVMGICVGVVSNSGIVFNVANEARETSKPEVCELRGQRVADLGVAMETDQNPWTAATRLFVHKTR